MAHEAGSHQDLSEEVRTLRERLAQAERALAECHRHKALFHTLLEQGPDAFLVFDLVESPAEALKALDHRAVIVEWNRAAERLYRYAKEEIIGKPLSVLIPPELPDELPRLLALLAGRGEINLFETVRLRKDGTRLPVSISLAPIRDSAGKVIGASGVVRDLTARNQAEVAAARLAALVESSDDAIVGESLDHTITNWNRGAERLFGYATAEVMGRPNSLLIPPDHAEVLADVFERVRRGEVVEQYETALRRKDGALVDVCLTVSPIRDGAGRIVGVSKIARDLTGRKRAEAALWESHNLLRAVIEGVPQAVFVKDRQCRYLMINSAGASLVGATVEEVLGRDDASLFAPETARQIAETDRQVMESGETVTFEEVATAAGVTRTYLSTKGPFRGPRGEVLGVFGVCRDITERKRTEEELRRQKEILQTVFDNIPVMIRFAEPSGRVQLVNRCWQEVLGWSLEEVRSRDLYADFYPDPQDRQRALDFIRQSPGGWSDFKVTARDGRILDTTWTGINLSDGTQIGIGLDVTERRRVERDLRASEARYRAIFDQADVGVVAAALDGWSLFSPNPGYCKIVGYSPEEVGRLTVADITPPEDLEVDLALARRLVAGEIPSYSLDKRYVRKGGEVVWVTLTCTLIRNPLGEPDFVVGLVQDITERKKAEIERERSHLEVAASRELLEVLSQRLIEAQEAERQHLARELHDELGQILTTVYLSVEALRAGVEAGALPGLEESLHVVNQAIEQVRSISLDLRPLSLDLLGLEAALHGYLHRRAGRAGLRADLDSALGGERLPAALETVCFRVVQEALTNTLRHAHAGRFWVELAKTDRQLHLTIRDDGRGFEVAAARRGALNGRGFGLLSMEERLHLVGGRIDIDSAPGSGTVIRVRFPLWDASATEPKEES